MEEDRETRTDEDVEGHVHHAHKQRQISKDEGDDVEGHKHKNVNLEADDVRVGKDDEGDDVEGHMNVRAVNPNQHKV